MHKNFCNKTLLRDSAEELKFKTFMNIMEIFIHYFTIRFLVSATSQFTEAILFNTKVRDHGCKTNENQRQLFVLYIGTWPLYFCIL